MCYMSMTMYNIYSFLFIIVCIVCIIIYLLILYVGIFIFPAEAYIIILKFSLTERCSHPGEDHTNEIKHAIHPE